MKSYSIFKKSIINSFIIINFLLIGCNGPVEKSTPNSAINESNEINKMNSQENRNDNNSDLLGIYHGVQPAYFLKNQYGDDMEINGNKVPVPSSDFKFILKEGGVVNLQQINLEDNSRIYYNGSFTVENNNDFTNIVCNLSDGHSSNPTYKIIINKSTGTTSCSGNNEPDFSLEKNTNSNSTSTTPTNSNVENQSNIDGTYSYRDESAALTITINGDSWMGKTTIISGMGDEYDKPEYQSGVIKGNELYEETGMVKIGYVNGRNLTTSIGGNNVTLSK